MSRPVLVLGIESSCDETAAAVVRFEGGLAETRSSYVGSQAELHAEYGGVVPEIASRAHVERLSPALGASLADAGITPGELGGVAVGHRPGLIGSLLVGVAAAKALSWSLGVPLVGVDHVAAHLYAGFMAAGVAPADACPALGLVVSGGHTALYRVGGADDIERLGATIDDALGEAYDKVASVLGLGYPGGPGVDRLAHEPGADDRAFALPVPRLGGESLDFTFSGLKTAVLYAARGAPRPKREGGGFPREASAMSDAERRDLAASFQRVACAAVEVKLARALTALRGRGEAPRSLVAGGGVVANRRLRSVLEGFAAAEGLRLLVPPPSLCVDNAAMVAGLGAELLSRGVRDGLTLTPVPTTAC